MRLFILFVLVFILWGMVETLRLHHNQDVREMAEFKEDTELELNKLRLAYCQLLKETGRGTCKSNILSKPQ